MCLTPFCEDLPDPGLRYALHRALALQVRPQRGEAPRGEAHAQPPRVRTRDPYDLVLLPVRDRGGPAWRRPRPEPVQPGLVEPLYPEPHGVLVQPELRGYLAHPGSLR